MATLRQSNSYSKIHVVPYTRNSKQKNKAYIKTIPPQKIVKFSMGDGKLYTQGKFPFELSLVCAERVQIRNNALEACRQHLNKKLDQACAGQYLFKVIPYPHHIQRENKMLTGAGADRMQTGMQLSFGKTIAKAALVKPGSKIFFIAVGTPKAVRVVRESYKEIKPKLPCRTKIVYEDKTKKS